MKFKLPPYLKWRDGRPRWEPGPRMRPAFRGTDLRDDAGNWLRLEAAIARTKELNAAAANWKEGGAAARAKTRTPRRATRTGRDLWILWASPDDPKRASPRWQKLSAVTRADYTSKIGFFLAEYGDEPVAALTKADMHGWWEDLYRERGHAMANGIMAVVRAMFSYGEIKGWITVNPAKGLGLQKVPPRVVVWPPSVAEAYVAKADELKMYGVADAVIIGLHSGQRQNDVLAFELAASTDARCRFRQSKTDARVSVPHTDQLAARLDAIRARRRAGKIAEIDVAGVIVRDNAGRQYTKRSFNRDFRIVRDAVAEDERAAGVNEPKVLGLHYLDLRDTAITRLALAGATVPEIRAITGHSLDTIHKVLAHYLALDDRMADAAISKLKTWMAAEGIAI